MKQSPEVSVVIPWCNRDELETTLLCNSFLFSRHAVQTIVVNVGGDSCQLSRLIARSGAADIKQIDTKRSTFNKALALNIGIDVSEGAWVFTLDADIILTTDIFESIYQQHDAQSYITIEWVCESNVHPSPAPTSAGNPIFGKFVKRLVNSSDLTFFFEDGTKLQYQVARTNRFDGGRAAPGLLLARRKHLVAVGGYNSNLCQWGWEDDDMQIRLQHVAGLLHIERGTALHLSHGDDSRALSTMSRAQSDQINFLQCCANYNLNRFQGTFAHDIRDTPRCVTNPASAGESVNMSEAKLSYGCVLAGLSQMTYCGIEEGVLKDACKDTVPIQDDPSVGSLVIEAFLRNMDLHNKTMLHVGIGNSKFASQFGSLLLHIHGVTLNESEVTEGNNLGLRNYTVKLCNKYGKSFRRRLPHNAYDIIVDEDIMSGTCCQFHLHKLVRSYATLLAPEGRLFTREHGSLRSMADNSWSLRSANLAYIAGQCRLSISRVHGVLYMIEHCKE